MQNALYLEISVVGICLLLIVLLNQRDNIGSSTLQRHFNLMIYATMAMLVIDAGTWLIDGADFLYARYISIILETLYYFFTVFIPYLWATYIELSLSKEQKQLDRKLKYLTVPLVISAAYLLFLNPFTEYVFIIDADNIYHRNTGYIVYSLLAYVYLVYATVLSLNAARKTSWKEDKKRYYPMAYFIVLPSIAGVIQLFFYGVALIWIFTAVSAMMMYIDSLNRQISTDPLTGINNRRELSKYLFRETKDISKNQVLALVMMDVDHFKEINDTYGHYHGDIVLAQVADVLKQSCKRTAAFLARYGGDEFCIVYPAANQQAVEDLIAKIHANIIRWNHTHDDAVHIGLSIGYSIWKAEAVETVDDLYKRADEQMYQAKNNKKKNIGVA